MLVFFMILQMFDFIRLFPPIGCYISVNMF